jgi:outer membrane biosynthesis protein TonB
MLSGRSGLRFALEALFLILLAIGAGLADLRPLVIVLVMAGGWALVAILEFTAQRISSAPLSYLLPAEAEQPQEAERVQWPMPEERTVVAPPQQRAEPEPQAAAELEPQGAAEPEAQAPPVPVAEEPEPEPEPEQEPEREPELAPLPPAAVEAVSATDEIPPARSRRLRSLLRRREREHEQEPEAHDPPRHVKLLPRKTAPESSRAEQEVAELFNESEKREEHGA